MSAATYEFDEDFQRKVVALTVRDLDFNIRTEGLISPGYFENVSHGHLVEIVLGYYEKYRAVPSRTVLLKLIKDAIASKRIREDMKEAFKDELAKSKMLDCLQMTLI